MQMMKKKRNSSLEWWTHNQQSDKNDVDLYAFHKCSFAHDGWVGKWVGKKYRLEKERLIMAHFKVDRNI